MRYGLQRGKGLVQGKGRGGGTHGGWWLGFGMPNLDLDPLRYLPKHEELGLATPSNGFSMGALPQR